MSEFFMGELVRCVNPGQTQLKLDQLYVVAKFIVKNRGVASLVFLNGVGNEYGLFGFRSDRFIKATVRPILPKEPEMSQDATKIFMVYNTTNRGTPRITHNTFDDAKNEANRLAEVHVNQEFVVLEASYAVKKVPQYVTEERNICISH